MVAIRWMLSVALVMSIAGLWALESAQGAENAPAWNEEFDLISSSWKVKKKPGTKAAEFTIQKSDDGSESWLLMTSDNATATLGIDISGVDLNKTPMLEWRWRVTVFPTGADGRVSEKDDQAIGIYISDGGMFSQKSLTYRWETETPVGEEGTAKYGAGTVSVKWIAVRNKDDGDGVTFFEESRNIAEDFEKAYGYVPKKFNIGISCNSQYTSSKAEAQLDYIRLVPKVDKSRASVTEPSAPESSTADTSKTQASMTEEDTTKTSETETAATETSEIETSATLTSTTEASSAEHSATDVY